MDRPVTINEQDYFRHERYTLLNQGEFHIVPQNKERSTSGKIRMMVHKRSGFVGIMKIVPSHRHNEVQNEVAALKIGGECPFMINLIDGFIMYGDGSQEASASPSLTYYIFLEYAPFRTLDHLTRSQRGIGSQKAKYYAIDIARALKFLHNRRIIHRDVKPENMFIRATGRVALGDFGLATDASTGCYKWCGTYLTRPVEVWDHKCYSLPADCWMFGISLYNIITNNWPFASIHRTKQIEKVREARLTKHSLMCDASFDLLKGLLQPDPEVRFTVDNILEHEYISTIESPFVPPFPPATLANMYVFGEEETTIIESISSS